MAAIQVYKTDTFEIQRQKINQIGDLLSNFSGGGNDFAAGNLKLGDGTIPEPSLAFTSDSKLGFYKPFPKTLGIVSDNKKVVEFSNDGSYFFKTLNISQNSLLNSEIRIDNRGTEYDSGLYTNVPIEGGTGSGATANLEIIEFDGSITSQGIGYLPGTYTNINISGGSGEGSLVNFSVDDIEGDITKGSGYTFGAYEGIYLTGGSGSGIIADILVSEAGEVAIVIIRDSGSGYLKDDVLSANSSDIGGTGSGFEYTITSEPGVLKDFSFSFKGFNYEIGDVLFLRNKTSGISSTLTSGSNIISVSSTDNIKLNDFVVVSSGTGSLQSNTVVVNINEDNTIELSKSASSSGSSILEFIPEYGSAAQDFEYTINSVREITSFSINNGGSGYIQNDILTFNSKNLVRPILYNVEIYPLQRITFSNSLPSGYFNVGGEIIYNNEVAYIYDIETSGNSLIAIYIDNINLEETAEVEVGFDTLIVSSVINLNAFFIGEENDLETTFIPNISFVPGNTYIFNFQDFNSDEYDFSLSSFPGGSWGSSLISNVNSTLDINSTIINVSSTTNIVEGMEVIVISGDGQLVSNTKVLSIDSSTQLTLTKRPLLSGNVILSFSGVEYTSNVTKSLTSLTIKVDENTPEILYYYNKLEANAGGISGREATITTDLLNPRTNFGSGFQATIAEITTVNNIIANPNNGNVKAKSIFSESSEIGQATGISLTTVFIETDEFVVSSIRSIDNQSDISLSSNQFLIESNVLVGSNFSISGVSGDLQTSGNIKTLSTLNVNDTITITNNEISSTSGNNLVLSPAPLRTAKVNSTTALVIPVGTNNQRPQTGVVETGAIRFNTDTEQYEGYSGTSQSWSSLGGVRDVDGNTYIIAEASVGSNDNTLYFYNNGLNTTRLTNNYFDFRSTKKIRSENMSAPSYTEWRANTPVLVGAYLKYKNNIYEVTIAGTTAGSANPPIHTTGIAINGTATLLWNSLSTSTLTFEEITELRVGPDGTTPLIINDELVLKNNVISSKLNDINIKPSIGKKVAIDATSSFVLPVGDNNQRGSAVRGSVRFNTSILQYEGYDGSNWSSLGGVRDVDGNTYIIPEISAGSNENILYFYNDDNNTLQLSSSGLDFLSTNNITASQTDTLNINVPVVTFDNLGLSIDNSGNSSIIASIKDSVDIDLSTGLNVENFVSFTSDGKISVNTGYSLGDTSKVNVLDSSLKFFELNDTILSTFIINLERGLINSGSDIIYNPSIHRAARMTVVVDNLTRDEREIIDFNICHKGADIFYTEYGNITTSTKLIGTIFDFTAGNEVRATFNTNANNNSGDIIVITLYKTIIKK